MTPDLGRLKIDPGKDANGTEYDAANPATALRSPATLSITQSAHRPNHLTLESIGRKRALDKK